MSTDTPPLRVAVLLSGEGTSLENLIERIQGGEETCALLQQRIVPGTDSGLRKSAQAEDGECENAGVMHNRYSYRKGRNRTGGMRGL